jgi:steroid 5-alpha reductase family enzyme
MNRSVVGIAYLVAGAAGVWGASAVGGGVLGLATGFLVSVVVIFAFSVATGNSSCFDPWWSVAPMILVLALPLAGPREMLVRGLVLVWGARLTWNWWRGWGGLAHEDWRYVRIRGQVGRWWWPVSFLGVHLFPATLVGLGSLPLLEPARSFSPIDGLAAVVTVGSIALEAVADQQLWRFRGQKGVLDSGVWRWSRHPNYLGEIGFWWGIWLFGGGVPWGALAITILFVAISIPLIERRHRQRRPEYAAYQARVPMLLPLPPRRR